jgi:hypothetical protein
MICGLSLRKALFRIVILLLSSKVCVKSGFLRTSAATINLRIIFSYYLLDGVEKVRN